MKIATRIFMLCCLFVSLTVFSYAQVGALAAAGAPSADPSYAQMAPVDVGGIATGSPGSFTFDAVTGAVISGASGTAAITANTTASAQAGNDDFFFVFNPLPTARTSTG